ncbi:hypothetical protein GCM10008013_45350 [Paenibacillus segetis]|uniref:DUF4239 domain-containing protein n=1 Tax=Paenibacillus segetis TaxID=1325360 RepID=A0ABQ1YV30_9BACL|nr:hypothetical protein GCM10008013_45350 [Paenibacillus segetis]
MSLSEWITWLQQHERTVLTSFLALSLFLGLYVASERKTSRRERSRLDHLRYSLELYSAAAGPLMREVNRIGDSPNEQELLSDKLLACRAAPYVTADLLTQIGAYIHDQDPTRLSLLQKTLERESEHLIEERETLLNGMERPGWGLSFWQQIRPIIPFLFALALFFCLCWLFQLIEISRMATANSGLTLLNSWTSFASVLFSLIVLYPALMGGRRRTEGSALLWTLSIFIALLGMLHTINLELAPYILGAQVLLFLSGFTLAGSKPRKSRPYVGHYVQDKENPLLIERTDEEPRIE